MFREQIAGIFGGWISGFTQLGMDTGMTETDASRLAQSVVVRVQGMLILAQTLDQPDLFGQVLTEIDTDFLPKKSPNHRLRAFLLLRYLPNVR